MALLKNITSGSIDGIVITGSLDVSNGITGSLYGTASWAENVLTASYALNAGSSSFAITASYALNGSGGGNAFPYTGSAVITGSLIVTGSTVSTLGFTGNLQGTASWAQNAISASYAEFATSGGTPVYIHSQSAESNLWSVTHSLGISLPLVTVYDSSNNVIIPQEITSTSTSSLSILFPISISGFASIAGGSFSTISIISGVTQEQSIINSLIFG